MKAELFASLLALASISAAATRTDMLVSTDWLAKHLTDPKIVILHVSGNRTAYDAGHVPGARFVPLSDIAVTRTGSSRPSLSTRNSSKLP